MGKSRVLEDALDRLQALRMAPAGEELRKELSKAIASKTNLIVAKAAAIAGEKQMAGLGEELAAAFDRFMINSATTDKGCAAKSAIATALYELGAGAEGPFLAGIRHVQMEASYGGGVDTAGDLRGACAMGLVRMGYRHALEELAALLTDKLPHVRVAAARAIAYSEREEGALLLRLKLLTGDPAGEVMAECVTGLLRLTPERGLEFAERFMESDDEDLRVATALAIGQTRTKGAADLLLARWESAIGDERRELLLPLALVRDARATEVLLGVLSSASGTILMGSDHRAAAASGRCANSSED